MSQAESHSVLVNGILQRPVVQVSSWSGQKIQALRANGHPANLYLARPLPNPSVKGTGLRPAPYVER